MLYQLDYNTEYGNLIDTEGHLPIDITAIGRTTLPNITLSLRFFELDLFSENSARVNAAIDRQWQLNREATSTSLFSVVEVDRDVDVDQRVLYEVGNLGLFAQPLTIRQIGQAEESDTISLLVIGFVLFFCAFLGYFLARAFLSKKRR